MFSEVLLGRGLWMSKFSRLRGSAVFRKLFHYRVYSCEVDNYFFSLNLLKSNVSSVVYFTGMLQKGHLSVLVQIAFLSALLLLFTSHFEGYYDFLRLRLNGITKQHDKLFWFFNMN